MSNGFVLFYECSAHIIFSGAGTYWTSSAAAAAGRKSLAFYIPKTGKEGKKENLCPCEKDDIGFETRFYDTGTCGVWQCPLAQSFPSRVVFRPSLHGCGGARISVFAFGNGRYDLHVHGVSVCARTSEISSRPPQEEMIEFRVKSSGFFYVLRPSGLAPTSPLPIENGKMT